MFIKADGTLYLGDQQQPADRLATAAEVKLREDTASAVKSIAQVELTITPRRLREAILTPEGRAWLEAADAQIAVLRGGKG